MILSLSSLVLYAHVSWAGATTSAAYLAVHKPELLTHLPPTAHLGPIDPTTLPPALAPELSEEEEIFRTAEAA